MRRGADIALAAAASLAALVPVRTAEAPHELLRRLLTQQGGFDDGEVARVLRGEVVVGDLRSPVTRQIGLAGAVRIDAPAARTVDLVRDIEQLERGKGFLATRKLSEPPTLADFASFDLPAQDVRALRDCRPDDCDVKLGLPALRQLQDVDWDAPDATAEARWLVRRMVLAHVLRYRKGGNGALAVYRDQERPTSIAEEFDAMLTDTANLTSAFPVASRYLRSYPHGRPAATDDFFYWSLAEFGLKPVFRLNHVVIHRTEARPGLLYVLTTKQLYASHYFHSALELRALVDDDEQPGRRHYLVVLNLARSDGLTGLFGPIVRGRVRSGARNSLRTALTIMRTRAQGGAVPSAGR